MYSLFCIPLLLGLSVAVIESHDDSHTLCVHSKGGNVKQGNLTTANYVDGNGTEHCSKPTDYCFILWQEEPKNKSIVILHQGCWDSTNNDCNQNECIAVKRTTKALNYTKFCCCSGNYCNTNITEGYLRDSAEVFEDPTLEFVDNMSYTLHIIVALVVMFVLSFLVVITYVLIRVYCSSPKASNESLHLMEAAPPLPPNCDLDTLKIQEKAVGHGGFGSVYCGVLKDSKDHKDINVAVKVFTYQNKKYFFNEVEIYGLPHLKHKSMPKYIGSKERPGEVRPEYLLVLSYCSMGCLQDYLKEHTVSWVNLCSMILSIAEGLAHLHTEMSIGKGDLKCSIAHRDLTSRNILVKPDGSCVICDFGFAICVSGAKYYTSGMEHEAEANSLQEAGTLRYMAPELLEGAVNLRDLETALKQIDVYALGLVLWEIASRCTDCYQGAVPAYKLPYEDKVGSALTMDQMQDYVARRKVRPDFDDTWKDYHPTIQTLKTTIDECWDHDAEARLTAVCVTERLLELRKTTQEAIDQGYKSGLWPCDSSPNSLHKKSSDDSNLALDCVDGNSQLICPRESVNSLSDCTTETLLSPSEAFSQQENNKNKMNSLILDSTTKVPNKKFYSFSDGDPNIITIPKVETAKAISSDFFNYSSSFSNSSSHSKNAHSSTIPKKHGPASRSAKDFFHKERKHWASKKIIESLASILPNGLRKTSVSNSTLPEEQQPLKSSGVSSPISPTETDGKHGHTNLVNTFWSSGAKNAQQQIENESKLLRPNGCNSAVQSSDNPFIIHRSDHISATPEIEILEKQETAITVQPNVLSQESDIDKDFQPNEKSKRPTTLPVQPLKGGLDDDDDSLDISDFNVSNELTGDTKQHEENTTVNPVVIRRKGSGNKRKGVRRVQTPFRLSLNDDRIMLPTGSKSSVLPSEFDSAKFSASVPNITLCSPTRAFSAVPPDRKKETDLQEIIKVKPLNGLTMPVNFDGIQNGFVV